MGYGKWTRCTLCGRNRRSTVGHHVTYTPEFVIPICNFCHWVIHRPDDVDALINKIKGVYVERYGPLPIKLGGKAYRKWHKKKEPAPEVAPR